jgi:hypothetical protein
MIKSRKYEFHDGKGGAALAIRVTPRSRKNTIDRILNDGTIKVKLTAPPVQAKANKALVKFLAEILDIKQSDIEIIAGEKGRNKLVTIYGLETEIVNQRIQAELTKT